MGIDTVRKLKVKTVMHLNCWVVAEYQERGDKERPRPRAVCLWVYRGPGTKPCQMVRLSRSSSPDLAYQHSLSVADRFETSSPWANNG